MKKSAVVIGVLVVVGVAVYLLWQRPVARLSATAVDASFATTRSTLPVNEQGVVAEDSTATRSGESNKELLHHVLQHVSRGGFIADSPEYQRFLQLAIADHQTVLALLRDRFDAIPAHETVARSQLFAVLIETGIAMKKANAPLDEFLNDAKDLVHRQLADPERVPLPRQGYTQAEISAMVHQGDYVYADNQMYANTFKPKYMAMAVYIEANNETSRAALAQIAMNETFDARAREIAARHVAKK